MLDLTHSVVDIAITCSHFDESLRFYHQLLGLEVVQEVRIPDAVARASGLAPRGFRQVRLRAGQTLIKLMEIPDPPERRTPAFAAGVRWLTFFVTGIGGGIGPIITGYLYDLRGTYDHAWLINLAVLVVSTFLILALRTRRADTVL